MDLSLPTPFAAALVQFVAADETENRGLEMADETLGEKAGFAVGYGIAAAEDAVGAIKSAFGSAVTALTGSSDKPSKQAVTKALPKKSAPTKAAKKAVAAKAVKKAPAKKFAAKKVAVKKTPAKKSPAKKSAKKSVKTPAKKSARPRG